MGFIRKRGVIVIIGMRVCVGESGVTMEHLHSMGSQKVSTKFTTVCQCRSSYT